MNHPILQRPIFNKTKINFVFPNNISQHKDSSLKNFKRVYVSMSIDLALFVEWYSQWRRKRLLDWFQFFNKTINLLVWDMLWNVNAFCWIEKAIETTGGRKINWPLCIWNFLVLTEQFGASSTQFLSFVRL